MSIATPIRGEGLVSRRLRIADPDVVWLRAVLEAYDHLAGLYGDGSGVVELVTTDSRAAELDRLLDDLVAEARFSRL